MTTDRAPLRLAWWPLGCPGVHMPLRVGAQVGGGGGGGVRRRSFGGNGSIHATLVPLNISRAERRGTEARPCGARPRGETSTHSCASSEFVKCDARTGLSAALANVRRRQDQRKPRHGDEGLRAPVWQKTQITKTSGRVAAQRQAAGNLADAACLSCTWL